MSNWIDPAGLDIEMGEIPRKQRNFAILLLLYAKPRRVKDFKIFFKNTMRPSSTYQRLKKLRDEYKQIRCTNFDEKRAGRPCLEYSLTSWGKRTLEITLQFKGVEYKKTKA